MVKGIRNRLKLKRIQNDEGEWLEDLNQIAEAATQFFQKQFSKEKETTYFEILEELPIILNDNRNEDLNKVPEMHKVKEIVLGLNRNSTTDPDGMTGAFFQDI